MARASLKSVRSNVVDQVLDDEELEEANAELDNLPAYVMIGDASIPVSKKAGPAWDQKIKDAISATQNERSLWDQAYADYRKVGPSDAELTDTKLVTTRRTDENLVRENVKTLLRTTYTRNPKIEFSSLDPAKQDLAKALTLGVSALLNRRVYPGLNAKQRIRRAIVHAHLTNFGILKLGYQDKAGSRQEALANRDEIRQKLKDAKDTATLDDLYAQLEQNEEMLPLYSNQGMTLGVTLPHRVIIDPNCTLADLSDCDWLAEEIFISTAYIKSKFLDEEEKGVYTRKSDGTEVQRMGATIGTDAAEGVRERVVQQVTGFTPDERQEILAKDKTRCYIIWDKLTREISLYIADDMKYPIWVWEDNLKLSRFFQHFIIYYTEPLDGVVQPGESSTYSGAAEEVNDINERTSFIRRLAFGELIYNTKVVKDTAVAKLISHMKNPKKFDAIGVEWDPEAKLTDVFQLFVPPDAQLPTLYDKSDLMKTIDRVNSFAPHQRGDQFRTNTTNKAIQEYNNQAATVTNELTDAVEDTLEELGWSMAELFVSKYDKEQVASLIGPINAEPFEPLSVEEFNAAFAMTVAAGSTEKPTSENKKREAIQIVQALGQFAQAAPMTAMTIATRLFSTAFSEFNFTKQDEQLLLQEIQRNLGAASAGAPAADGTQPPPPNDQAIPA